MNDNYCSESDTRKQNKVGFYFTFEAREIRTMLKSWFTANPIFWLINSPNSKTILGISWLQAKYIYQDFVSK